MGTCLKGLGAFRKQLLLEIIAKFGRASFSYKDASSLPGFDRSTFMNLYQDRLIKKASPGIPLRYSIISRSLVDIKRQKPESDVDGNCQCIKSIANGGGACCDNKQA